MFSPFLSFLTTGKKLFSLFVLFGFFSSAFAQVNLSLETISLSNTANIYHNDEIRGVLSIKNSGSTTAFTNGIPTADGFVSCTVNGQLVFNSSPIDTLIINPDTSITFPITLSSLATKTIGNNQTLSCQLDTYPGRTIINSSQIISFSVQAKPLGRFDMTLDKVKEPISNKLDSSVAELGIGGVKSRIYTLIDTLAIPAAVFVGIFFSLLALYKIMFSPDKAELNKITHIILYGVIGVVLMLSAKFFGKVLFETFQSGEIGVGQFNAVDIIGDIYDLILYPFLKLFYYIAMGALFVVLLLRVLSFVNETAEEVRKKTANIIIATVAGLLVIIGSKQLVEGVYGREEQIRNGSAISVTDVGSSFLSDANIPIIYNIIQRAMGLAGFAVLAIILVQTFNMLTDPTNEAGLTDIRKTILYVLIGMFVIGAGYLIVNVVMLN